MAVKVMIADDHSMIREGLKQLLELEGDFEVIAEACDGVDCLEKLKTVVPDILLLDINMPNMNGLELVKKIRADGSHIKTPIIMITTEGGRGEVIAALRAGVNNYIVKPFPAETLKEKLDVEHILKSIS